MVLKTLAILTFALAATTACTDAAATSSDHPQMATARETGSDSKTASDSAKLATMVMQITGMR